MNATGLCIVDYSTKAIAVPAEYDTALLEEFQALGGRFNKRLKFGPGWIFSKGKSYIALVGLLQAYGIEFSLVTLSGIDCKESDKPDGVGVTTTGSAKATSKPDYIAENKDGITVTLTDGGTLVIYKDKLETEFCFGYSCIGQGDSSETAHADAREARTSEQYFIDSNLKDLNDYINLLAGKRGRYRGYAWLASGDGAKWYVYHSQSCPEATNAVDCLDPWELCEYEHGRLKRISDADRERIIAGYKHALVSREKRCRSYLKRYGLSKLRVWTYCRDD